MVCPDRFAARFPLSPNPSPSQGGGELLHRSIGLQTVKGRTARQRRSWAVPPCCPSTALAHWGGRATHGWASLLPSAVGDRTRVHVTTALRWGGVCQGALVLCQRNATPWYFRGTGRRRRLRAAPPSDDLKINSTHYCGDRSRTKLAALDNGTLNVSHNVTRSCAIIL